MKILILEPFYTNFHIELAKSLSNDVKVLVFNLGNNIYLNGAKKTFVHKNIINTDYNDRDIELVKDTKTLYTETLRKIDNSEPKNSDLEYMAKYVSFFRKYLLKNKIQLVTMHNDLRWQHALSIKICQELGIKYLITERGIFRPDTTTIDFLGVNGYSSLPKNKEFYENYNVKEKTLKSYKVNKWINLKVNIKFAIFIVLNKIGDFLGINSKIKNKNYNLLNYIELFIKQKFSKKVNKDIKLPKKYIFVPLQVNTDTQILIHSDFKNMQEFISKVEDDFYSIDTNISLVFKIHPMEIGIVDYKFDDRSIIVNSDTNELVKNSECVITINSTVGFEAIKEYKKVLVLGEAFFKIDGISICSSKDNFKKDLQDTIQNNNTISNIAINKFVNYLKYEYQVNGNLFNWDKKTLEEVKSKIYNLKPLSYTTQP